MNVRTITSLTFAITLLAPTGAIFADEDFPYTGPDKPVITTASNDVVVRYGRDSIHVRESSEAIQATRITTDVDRA